MTAPPCPAAETPIEPQLPSLVLFGRDAAGKLRAGWYDAGQARAATEAAGTSQLSLLTLTDEAQRSLAVQLGRGRVLASGKAFLPFVKRELYSRLVVLACNGTAPSQSAKAPSQAPQKIEPVAVGKAPSTRSAAEPAPPVARSGHEKSAAAAPESKPRPADRSFVGSPLPQDRDEIGLGSFVLALEAPAEGWWEAEVIGINGSVFSLRWRDYPTDATILRKASELALLPPSQA
ncbi:hypothetical protein [Methylobacterium oxalidis]|uniref:Uncharacterized protein n=1 Tax=Methylobacterium oxalidis TaxID=944322 RepID=A0A512JCD1_9HYPH|nr:hypothetical protein [Methylobacterium oxalidis]GEP07613.1 hypothetical protein MOX02_56510 [Methylobacterium oxalidis]GJE33456.1 hypothetical protein LDDCCGHA_3656 [Methylobacterium oxalidis]GLS66197.1 hypothetical protein GCM10007888_45790 [Methylobacterium oxalidis]